MPSDPPHFAPWIAWEQAFSGQLPPEKNFPNRPRRVTGGVVAAVRDLGGGRADGCAVIAVGARDDLHAVRLPAQGPVAAHRLEGGIAGFGAAGGEEGGVE